MFISWRGTQRRVGASYPGELNVFYLKAQDGIKAVAGGFTTRQHKHLVLFSQSTECQGWFRIVMLLILMFGSHAPGTELTRAQAGCVGGSCWHCFSGGFNAPRKGAQRLSCCHLALSQSFGPARCQPRQPCGSNMPTQPKHKRLEQLLMRSPTSV